MDVQREVARVLFLHRTQICDREMKSLDVTRRQNSAAERQVFLALRTFRCRILRAFGVQKRRDEVVRHHLSSDWFGFFGLGVVFQACQGERFLL